MGKQRGGRGSKYSDEFKRRLVAESHVDGVSVPMVSRRHSVPTSRIYAWRGDVRFSRFLSQNPPPTQNSLQMNLSTQLLTPCDWTVHRLEGGWPVCRGSWSVRVGRSNPLTVVHGAIATQRDGRSIA